MFIWLYSTSPGPGEPGTRHMLVFLYPETQSSALNGCVGEVKAARSARQGIRSVSSVLQDNLHVISNLHYP